MQFVSRVRKLTIVAGIVLLYFLIIQPAALATSFDSVIEASGSIELDTSFTFGDDVSGDFSTIQVGSTTTTTYIGTGVSGTGSNPIDTTDPPSPDFFTDLNDGFGFTGSAHSKSSFSLWDFGIGLDFDMDLKNTSSDVYKVGIRVTTSNWVNASGTDDPDAYANSEFTIDDSGATPAEVFFTDFTSDLIYGNEENGTSTGVYGGLIGENTNILLEIILNPGDTKTLTGAWTAEGEILTAESLADVNLTAGILIESVTNMSRPIPEPGTIFLLGFGLLGIAGLSRTRKNRV
jgi:hypothetical protein